MSEGPSSIVHATFTLDRTFATTPDRVFAGFADPEVKSRWFGDPESSMETSLDFRVGGRESMRGPGPGGAEFWFEVLYQDIVQDERIVYTYEMGMDGRRISVSVATFEFAAVDGGTRLTVTEMGAFLDGLDDPALREKGTGDLLDALGTELERRGWTTAAQA